MKKLTIMVIPDGVNATRQYRVPQVLLRVGAITSLGVFGGLGFLTLDYLQLRSLRGNFQTVTSENDGLKGEARVLMQNLEEVKRSLRRVQDYTSKLGEITSLKLQKVSKETGIGPLTPEEYSTAQRGQSEPTDVTPTDYRPVGINLDNLVFRPVFDGLNNIGREANQNALELQHLLSTLSQQKSLLSSIPTAAPVDGWITSGFGYRVSPFTGERTSHFGLDIAAPVGTPIHAPADGVVIFTGAKEGFGNFIMVAHGYGVVTRYGHNAQNMVQPGQRITRGDQIGTVGMTGRTTGPHVHYEVVVNGKTENPKKFILELDDGDGTDAAAEGTLSAH
jgi:murein DD-endopeptidase MepM/ murein hydrolase activator NlpD